MSNSLAPKLDADDVVQSAFRSFFVRVRRGESVVKRGADLWSLLASITRHKLLKKTEYYRQQKRDADHDEPLGRADLLEWRGEPTAAEALALSDELTFLMSTLGPRDRMILEKRLQGASIPVIADAVDRSERTVRRFLARFRSELERRLHEARQV